MKKVCIFFVNYGPYHLARVQATYSLAKVHHFEVIGLELAREEVEYSWITNTSGFSFPLHTVVKNKVLQEVPMLKVLYDLFFILNDLQSDIIVISGYSRPAMILALGWCLWKKKISILLSETTEQDFDRKYVQEKIKSWVVKLYQAALVGGKHHKKYLIKLGMKPETIFTGYDVVDNLQFSPDKIRSLPCSVKYKYFLAINRFIPKKNLITLLKAYKLYIQAKAQNYWHLILCGDGELRSELEETIIDLKLSSTVYLTGFLQQEQLLPYFAHAQCFIHASTTEQWGLVVNEALAAGLPVIVSNRCGCFEDLVLEGINGFGFDPYNTEELANLMIKMSSGEVNLEAMRAASLNHIQNFTPEHFARGLKQAIDYALAHR